MKRMMVLTAAVLLLFIAVSPAAADREWGGRHGRGPGGVEGIGEAPELNLTVPQAERIKTLRAAYRNAAQPLLGRLASRRDELRDLWLAKTPDRERILALQGEVRGLRAELMDRLGDYRQEFLRILTPEQKNRLEAFERERRAGTMGGGGMMHGGPPEGARRGEQPRQDSGEEAGGQSSVQGRRGIE